MCHEGYTILKGVEIEFGSHGELFILSAFHIIWWLYSVL
jgi:hypothetical protein